MKYPLRVQAYLFVLTDRDADGRTLLHHCTQALSPGIIRWTIGAFYQITERKVTLEDRNAPRNDVGVLRLSQLLPNSQNRSCLRNKTLEEDLSLEEDCLT